MPSFFFLKICPLGPQSSISVSKITSSALFWQVMDTRGQLLTTLGYGFWPCMVLLSEIVQTFILADFCYYYVKRWVTSYPKWDHFEFLFLLSKLLATRDLSYMFMMSFLKLLLFWLQCCWWATCSTPTLWSCLSLSCPACKIKLHRNSNLWECNCLVAQIRFLGSY